MKIYVCCVPENLPAMKWEAYLAHALPLLPYTVIRDALKRRDVKADGSRVGRDDPVLRGARVKLYTDYEASVPIVYEDEKIILINKPAGLSSDLDRFGGMTVQNVLTDVMREAEGCFPVHRLDNRTSGLMLIARDAETHEILTGVFRERQDVIKRYECIVKGTVRPGEAICRAYLVKNAAEAKVRVISHNTPGSREIITEYSTLCSTGNTTRLLVTLHTGRTHQIRAHMAYLGHPVLGDDLYGDRNFNRSSMNNLCLCSCELSFSGDIPVASLKNQKFTVEAPF